MATNNKIFSDRQEKTIAQYLGWRQVSGSGSRPFHVGDVISDEWLGECKTHNTPGHKITFRGCVWDKLRDESKSCNRYAVYFVDDGSQRLNRTYCAISCIANPFTIDASNIDSKTLTCTSSGNVIFLHDSISDSQIYATKLGSNDIFILSIRLFYSFLG